MKKYMMSLDAGTTSNRCILFDEKGTICSVAQKEFTQYFPQPGWVEHDASEIWEGMLSVAREAMAKFGVSAAQIAGIGITNQRETTIVWDRETGEPVSHAIVWQCRRTADWIEALTPEFHDYLQETTGLVPDPYFSATKLAWILQHVEGAAQKAAEGRLLFGTVDTWLIWKLSGGKVFVTDYSNASRTMLFDIHRLCWDERILAEFGIPASMLAKVCPSSGVYGQTEASLFGEPIPIAGAAGDQQAALFGQCCFEPGDVKNTYGTGCFILMNTGKKPVKSRHGLVTTIAASTSDAVDYVLEGSVFCAGSCIQWLRDGMGLVEHAADSQALAESVPDTGGVYIVPSFTGMGAPYWEPYARGMVTGITRGTTRAHFVRAALESIAYQSADVLRAMEQDMQVGLHGLKVDGGAAANPFLLQFQADILHIGIVRPACLETTALGAAYLAGLAVGYWKNLAEIRANWQEDCVFEPEMEESLVQEKMNGWHRAVKNAIGWAHEL